MHNPSSTGAFMMTMLGATGFAVALAFAIASRAQTAPEPSTQPPPRSDAPSTAGESEPDTQRSRGAQDAGAADANAGTAALGQLAWLEGCWQGSVNQREFREQWLPLRAGLLLGAGQSVMRGRMLDYQFLRLEPRADGIYFTQFSGDRNEASFKLASMTTDDKDTIYTFANTRDAFPERLVYRRGVEGWLYQTIEGALNGSERKVIYPLRRVDCESGELIRK
jgi:uncharacterized protein DUF6265